MVVASLMQHTTPCGKLNHVAVDPVGMEREAKIGLEQEGVYNHLIQIYREKSCDPTKELTLELKHEVH